MWKINAPNNDAVFLSRTSEVTPEILHTVVHLRTA